MYRKLKYSIPSSGKVQEIVDNFSPRSSDSVKRCVSFKPKKCWDVHID